MHMTKYVSIVLPIVDKFKPSETGVQDVGSRYNIGLTERKVVSRF